MNKTLVYDMVSRLVRKPQNCLCLGCQYVLDAMMIPFDPWDVQSMREKTFFSHRQGHL